MGNEISLVDLPDWPEDLKSTLKLELPEWPEDAGPLPRRLRNPHTAALSVLSKLDAWGEKCGFKTGEFIALIFAPAWEKNIDPDESEKLFIELCDEGRDPMVLTANVVAAMCVRAFKAYSEGEVTLAWSYALDAESWYGTFLAGDMGVEFHRRTKADMAKKGADVAHAENRSMKLEVFAWLAENRTRFKSKEKTAEEIAKQQPIARRTAYGWITDWEKLQSASTL